MGHAINTPQAAGLACMVLAAVAFVAALAHPSTTQMFGRFVYGVIVIGTVLLAVGAEIERDS